MSEITRITQEQIDGVYGHRCDMPDCPACKEFEKSRAAPEEPQRPQERLPIYPMSVEEIDAALGARWDKINAPAALVVEGTQDCTCIPRRADRIGHAPPCPKYSAEGEAPTTPASAESKAMRERIETYSDAELISAIVRSAHLRGTVGDDDVEMCAPELQEAAEDRFARLTSENARLSARLDDATRSIDLLMQSNAHGLRLREDVEAENARLTRELDKAHEAVVDFYAEREQLRGELATTQENWLGDARYLRQQITALRSKLEAAMKERDELLWSRDYWKRAFKETRAEERHARSEWTDAILDAEIAHCHISKLEDEITQLRAALPSSTASKENEN